MRPTLTFRSIAAGLLLLVLPGVATAVSIQSGDILVSGGNYQSPGIARLLPDGTTQVVTPGLYGGIAVDRRSGRIYVMGPANGGSGLLEIDRATGAAHVIVQDSRLYPGPLTVGPDGMVYTMPANYTGTQPIFRIDPDSGAIQQVFLNQSPIGPVQGASFGGIASTSDGKLLVVANSSSFNPTSPGSIYRIDPATGQATFLGDPPDLTYPFDLESLPDGRIVSASVTPNCTTNCAKTVIFDPATSSETVLDTALLPSTPYDLELDGAGNLLVVGPTTNGQGNVVRIDLATGAQTLLGDPVALSGYDYVAYVPEPAPIALLTLALAAAAWRARSGVRQAAPTAHQR